MQIFVLEQSKLLFTTLYLVVLSKLTQPYSLIGVSSRAPPASGSLLEETVLLRGTYIINLYFTK